jgi:GNAT superfamily N-acetyltransferase
MDNLLQLATVEDAPQLAKMNQMLIADEGADNTLSRAQLEERMRRWLADGTYQAVLIHHNDDVVGYVLYREEQNEFNPEQLHIYVRQFFIRRAYRRRGIGHSAFEQVAGTHFPPKAIITLEVLASNVQGRAFWERLGFQPYYTAYRRQAHQGNSATPEDRGA